VSYLALKHIGAPSIEAGLTLCAAFVPAALISRYIAGIFQGQLQMGAFYSLRLSMAATIAVSLAVLIAVGEVTIWSAVGSYIAGIAVMVGLTVWHTHRVSRKAERTSGQSPSGRELLRYGVRSLAGSVYPIESLYLDQLLVAMFLSKADLGLYVTAIAFTSGPRLVAYAIGVTSMPVIARSPRGRGNTATWRQLGIALAGVGTVTAALILLIPLLLPALFGHDFERAVDPGRFLLLGSLFYGLRRVLGDCLRGLGQPGLVSVVEMASWPFLVGAAAAGTAFGLIGISIALCVVQFLSFVALLASWRVSRRSSER
jgi:O-antigen/teichoic acid export membrane protein